MSEEIINRVQKSGLITINLDDIKLPKNIFELDIKCWLYDELFLKEKEYRASVLSHDWSKYKNSYVYVNCSSDAIVPTWAYMLVSSQLENFTNKVTIGTKEKFYERYFENAIDKLDFTIYKDKSVIIKGCSDEKIPLSAYHLITTKLKPIAKSIMYGEACSAVPIHKRSN